jgi:hypothetical protein
MNMYVKNHIYIYIYIYVCVCVCACAQKMVCINSIFPANSFTFVEHKCCNHALDNACVIYSYIMNFA